MACGSDAAAAVAHRLPAHVPTWARHRRMSPRVLRSVRQSAAAVRRPGWETVRGRLARPFGSARARVPSAMTKKTAGCAAVWGRARPAPVPAVALLRRGYGLRPPQAMARVAHRLRR